MAKVEFYEHAVAMGYYGPDLGGLAGKKDYVRKFWEDIVIKIALQPALVRRMSERKTVRIVDLGCGSGEGIQLLGHVPMPNALRSAERAFVLDMADIADYVGLDLSPAMVEQGRCNYERFPQVRFRQADLSRGFPLRGEPGFDVYFSSYASLSHLKPAAFARLIDEIAAHAPAGAILVLDMMGRYSPEWPAYWHGDGPRMLSYDMSYLPDPASTGATTPQTYDVCYWTGDALRREVEQCAVRNRRPMALAALRDRSILIGRHMGTGRFNGHPQSLRVGVNRLFHRDYRGESRDLIADLDYLRPANAASLEAYARIMQYHDQWTTIVGLVEALRGGRDADVKFMLESSAGLLAEEMRMLAWLYRNADRFSVVDFWASVMGPQVACVLRNLEMALPDGLGCGHGLLGIVEFQ